jgi:anti-sigma-K factor RskA
MQNDLIGYLLGALETAERDAVDLLLESNTDARRQLEILRHCLVPLEGACEDCEIPASLAARTCQRIRASLDPSDRPAE